MSEEEVMPTEPAEIVIYLDESGELKLRTTPDNFHPALINLWVDMVKSSILSTFRSGEANE